MGMDATLAVERARSRSRVGRKRTRSEGPAAMEVDGDAAGSQPPKKRLHSSKSRSVPGLTTASINLHIKFASVMALSLLVDCLPATCQSLSVLVVLPLPV